MCIILVSGDHGIGMLTDGPGVLVGWGVGCSLPKYRSWVVAPHAATAAALASLTDVEHSLTVRDGACVCDLQAHHIDFVGKTSVGDMSAAASSMCV